MLDRTARSVVGVLALLLLCPMLAWSSAPADHSAKAPCTPVAVDATSPEVTAWLAKLPADAAWLALGQPKVQYLSSNTKVAIGSFDVQTADGLVATVTFKCSGACTGNGCGVTGCDPVESGCSACSCNGTGCTAQCTCTKSTTVVQADQ